MFVQTVEKRQGLKSPVWKIGWRNGWLDDDGVKRAAKQLEKNRLRQYLRWICSVPVRAVLTPGVGEPLLCREL